MLTAKQSLFVKEYLVDLNATQAAIRTGYSEKTANEQGARLLANVSIKEAIQAGMDKRAKKAEITADFVLNTIVETINRAKEMDANGKSDNSSVLKGCELLGKHLKLFTDKHEVSGAVNFILSNVDERI